LTEGVKPLGVVACWACARLATAAMRRVEVKCMVAGDDVDGCVGRVEGGTNNEQKNVCVRPAIG
jgi:hypothetical protein